jgi:hypothetical protein
MVGLPAVLHHAFLDDYLQHACAQRHMM